MHYGGICCKTVSTHLKVEKLLGHRLFELIGLLAFRLHNLCCSRKHGTEDLKKRDTHHIIQGQ